MVQTADDVQQCGLAGTAGPENGHELAVLKFQGYAVQRGLGQVAGYIGFRYIFYL